MQKLFKYILDFTALALLYIFWLRPKWKNGGKRVLAVNTVMFLYLSGVLLVTLMPVIASLPFCFNHPYVPMNMTPCRRASGKSCGLFRCFLSTAALSLSVELLQPLINGVRSSDITDVITNTAGGLIGYSAYILLILFKKEK